MHGAGQFLCAHIAEFLNLTERRFTQLTSFTTRGG
jgi:hypothetical protein